MMALLDQEPGCFGRFSVRVRKHRRDSQPWAPCSAACPGSQGCRPPSHLALHGLRALIRAPRPGPSSQASLTGTVREELVLSPLFPRLPGVSHVNLPHSPTQPAGLHYHAHRQGQVTSSGNSDPSKSTFSCFSPPRRVG